VHPVGVFEQQPEGEEEEAEIRAPMLLLRDDLGRKVQVPIGSCDGLAIHIALSQQVVARPLTHDLGLHLLDKLSSRLEHVLIDDYSLDGCRATLRISSSTGPRALRARAGDGIALALRADLPIFMTEAVFELTRTNDDEQQP
jgi:hypothetical protein